MFVVDDDGAVPGGRVDGIRHQEQLVDGSFATAAPLSSWSASPVPGSCTAFPVSLARS